MTQPTDLPNDLTRSQGLSQVNRAADGGTIFAAAGDQVVNFGRDVPYSFEAYAAGSPPIEAEWLRQQPSRLLDARREIVDFTGRELELGDLDVWINGAAPHAVRLMHGPGGQGKTRLAHHFAASRVEDGWGVYTARLQSESLQRDTGQSARIARHSSPLLVVVDYADRWPLPDLVDLLAEVGLSAAPKSRVLLIARGVQAWPALRAVLADSGASTDDRLLPALANDHDERVKLFGEARNRFASVLEVRGAEDLEPSYALDSEPYGLVLSLHMAALVAVDAHSRGQRGPSAPEDMVAYLLDRELLNWRRLYRTRVLGEEFDTPPTTMGRAVFASVLAGPTSHSRAVSVLSGVRVPSPQRVLVDHRICYPPQDRGMVLEPLYPDRLAEDFLALLLPGHNVTGYDPDPWAPDAVTDLLALDTSSEAGGHTQALVFLAAAATRWGHVCEQLGSILEMRPKIVVEAGSAALIAVADVTGLNLEVLRAIALHFPEDRDVGLDAGVAVLTERIVDARLVTETAPDVRARLLTALSTRLINAGRWQDAVSRAQAARDIILALPSAEQRNHGPLLAMLHTNVSCALSEVGDARGAAEASRSALVLYRARSATDLVEYRDDLAMALNNYSVDLSALGGYHEAVEAEKASREALGLYRLLGEAEPESYASDIAMVLGNLASKVARTGHPVEALELSLECVRIYRTLFRARPAEFDWSLANALVGLSNDLTAMDQRGDALLAIEEAVNMFRKLAAVNPRAYDGEFGNGLNTLGNRLAEVGRHKDGLQAAEASVAIFRHLAVALPALHRRDLARALVNRANRLQDLQRLGEALKDVDEGQSMFLTLSKENPEQPDDVDAAWSAQTRGEILGSLGHTAAAIVATQRAVDVLRSHAARDPGAHSFPLADALVQLALRHYEAGAVDEAKVTNAEAVALYRGLSVEQRKATRLDLARALVDGSRFEAPGAVNPNNVSRANDLKHALAILRDLQLEIPLVVAEDMKVATSALHRLKAI